MDGGRIEELWLRFTENRDDATTRDELILHYMRLVNIVVRRMIPKYNTFTEFDDLISIGTIGLIDAMERFEPERGIMFETYATTRIRGEILDYLRSQDWASPSMRHRVSLVTNMFDELETKYDRPPKDSEVAKALDMPVGQVRDAVHKAHIFNIISFESAISGKDFVIDIPDNDEYTPENQLLQKDLKNRLVKIIEALPERERLIISLYYYDRLRIKEIAEILSITEGRVSQIHSKVLEKIRKQLAE